MNIPEYKNLDEKRNWFTQIIVESKKDLDDALKIYNNNNKWKITMILMK